MRATLIHNPKAGSVESVDTLVDGLRDIGWKVGTCLVRKQLDECLRQRHDVVVVAGGDGTVSKVAKHLAGTNVPLAIVPMGTANNVARSLGLGVDPKSAIAALGNAKERFVDLGTIKSDGVDGRFFEGFGMGVFAYVIGEKDAAAKKKKKLRKALGMIADELETYAPPHYDIQIDGRDVSGKYVVAAVMNMRSFGPALGLAPDAKCDDGELDVVLIGPESREALLSHLRRASENGDIVLPSFEVVRAQSVTIRGDGRWTHADDAPSELFGELTIGVDPGAVRVLAP